LTKVWREPIAHDSGYDIGPPTGSEADNEFDGAGGEGFGCEHRFGNRTAAETKKKNDTANGAHDALFGIAAL
jgi:hypothetical protein